MGLRWRFEDDVMENNSYGTWRKVGVRTDPDASDWLLLVCLILFALSGVAAVIAGYVAWLLRAGPWVLLALPLCAVCCILLGALPLIPGFRLERVSRPPDDRATAMLGDFDRRLGADRERWP